MDIYELVARVGGEIVVGRAKVRQGDHYVIIGKEIDGELQMTAAGVLLAKELAGESTAQKPRAKRAAKKVEEPIADAQSELDLSILGD